MSMGTSDRLNAVIGDLLTKSKGIVHTCVVTNERGLIVAGTAGDWSYNETLAAMISLMSETAIRINTNLQLDNPELASVSAAGTRFMLHEFFVRQRRFRIGVITKGEQSTKLFIQRRFRRKHIRIEDILLDTANQVKAILEGR